MSTCDYKAASVAKDTTPAIRETASRWAGPGVQARLRVNPLGNSFEREANQVADRVMSMTGPAPAYPANGPRGLGSPFIQRQTEPEEENKELSEEEAEDEFPEHSA